MQSYRETLPRTMWKMLLLFGPLQAEFDQRNSNLLMEAERTNEYIRQECERMRKELDEAQERAEQDGRRINDLKEEVKDMQDRKVPSPWQCHPSALLSSLKSSVVLVPPLLPGAGRNAAENDGGGKL